MLSARMEAATNGEKSYHGAKCKNCEGTKRSTINSSCVKCANKNALIYVTRQRQKIKDLLSKANKR